MCVCVYFLKNSLDSFPLFGGLYSKFQDVCGIQCILVVYLFYIVLTLWAEIHICCALSLSLLVDRELLAAGMLLFHSVISPELSRVLKTYREGINVFVK